MFVGVEVNIILSHSQGDVCVLFRIVTCLVDGPAVDRILLQIMPVACAFKKAWPAVDIQKITCYPQPPQNAARENFVGNIFVPLRLQLLFLSLTSRFHSL